MKYMGPGKYDIKSTIEVWNGMQISPSAHVQLGRAIIEPSM